MGNQCGGTCSGATEEGEISMKVSHHHIITSPNHSNYAILYVMLTAWMKASGSNKQQKVKSEFNPDQINYDDQQKQKVVKI